MIKLIVIVFSVVLTALTLLLIVFSNRITIPASAIILSALSVLFTLFTPTDLVVWNIAPVLLCFAGWGYFCYRFKSLNFDNRILSFSLDKNKTKDGRIIGKCFPYYKKQLKYNNSTIVQNDISLNGGTIITGASGSGKTYSIIKMIMQDIEQGKSVAFFNFKGDKETAEDIKKNSGNAKVYELSWDSCNFTYDPLINLDEAGKVDAILNMRKWSIDGNDAHYKTGVQLFLQKSLKEFNYSGGNFLKEFYDFLRTYNVPREMYEAYNTTIKLLELTITSNVGSHMFTTGENEFKFDSSEQYVLIVGFTSSTKALGTSITSLMLRDLMEVGTRKKYNPSLCLYIDEFGSCESTIIVKDILEKGRSCGISAVISMQDLNQLIINTNAPFLDSVLGTVNSYIVFAGSTKQTAEMMSGTQIYEIDKLIMSLKKPVNGKPPTAVFISKYPVFENGGTEVYRFIPYNPKKKKTDFEDINKEEEKIDNEPYVPEEEDSVEEVYEAEHIGVKDLDQFL